MPYFWLFHIIQQARASGIDKKNAPAWAAASYYLWMNEQEEAAVSKRRCVRFSDQCSNTV